MAANGGRPGHNWDGHLPSDKMERAILFASEGIEDEDGKVIGGGFLKQDDDEMAVFRQRRVNTGPKGVIEDQKRDAAMKKLMAQADAVRRQETLKRQANATCRPAGEESDEDDEFEDEEFKKYKLERLRQMQKAAASAASSMPTFGTVETIPALEMPKAIDTVGSSQTYVIVHLQEEYLASCVRLTFKLGDLAKKYDQVRFLNIRASEAKPDLDPAELPILIVYKDGDYLGDVHQVGRQEGEALTTDKVEQTLLALGVRFSAVAQMKAGEAAAMRKMRELGLGPDALAGGDDDDDDESEDSEDDEADGVLKRKGVRIIGLS